MLITITNKKSIKKRNIKLNFVILLIISSCFSCSSKQGKQTEESELFSENWMRSAIAILQEYQNCDTTLITGHKQTSFEIDFMLSDSLNGIDAIHYIDSNTIRIDSIVNLCVECIEKRNLFLLMKLLDEEKDNFYAHSANHVFSLMGEFNQILIQLYHFYLSKEEAIDAEISIRKLRLIMCFGIIDLRESNNLNVDDYIFLFLAELANITNLYRDVGDKEQANTYSDALLEGIDALRITEQEVDDILQSF